MLRITGGSIYVARVEVHGLSHVRGFRSQASRAFRKRNLDVKILVDFLPPEVQNVVPSARTGASEIVLAGVTVCALAVPRQGLIEVTININIRGTRALAVRTK